MPDGPSHATATSKQLLTHDTQLLFAVRSAMGSVPYDLRAQCAVDYTADLITPFWYCGPPFTWILKSPHIDTKHLKLIKKIYEGLKIQFPMGI